jgi:hypothetical protein
MRIWLLAVAMLASACLAGSPETVTEDDASQVEATEQSLRLNPCATVRCANGYHCVATGGQAQCVPVAECSTDADCSLYSNYCGGCSCDALGPFEKPIKCLDPVQCLIDPCANKKAVCEEGSCVVSDGSVRDLTE